MVEYYMHSMQVFLSHLQKHNQIIQIDQAVGEVQLTHTILHKPLEGSQVHYKVQKAFYHNQRTLGYPQ